MASARPTLRSLAREAGVSAMTVSLALRNSPEISVATRRRITRLAEKRGYLPDPTIAKLMQHLRSRGPSRFQGTVAGLHRPWPLAAQVRSNYLERLFSGITPRAQSLGYSLELFDLDQYPTSAQLTRVLQNRGIEGVMILPMYRAPDLTARLDWTGFSTISVTSAVTMPAFHSVVPHHFENTRQACQELTSAGLSRIGFAISHEMSARVGHRWAAAMAWHNLEAGAKAVPPLISTQPGIEVDPQELLSWLKREQPDVVLASRLTQSTIENVVQSLPSARRPKLATLDWPEDTAWAGIDQRSFRIGEAAVELLAGMLVRGEKGVPAIPHTTMVEGVWNGPKTKP